MRYCTETCERLFYMNIDSKRQVVGYKGRTSSWKEAGYVSRTNASVFPRFMGPRLSLEMLNNVSKIEIVYRRKVAAGSVNVRRFYRSWDTPAFTHCKHEYPKGWTANFFA